MVSVATQVATRRVFQGRPSALNTVRMGSAQRMGVKPTHSHVRRSALSIPLTKRLALLKAAATSLTHEGFAEGMLDTRRFAQLQGAVQMLKLVDSARNMAPVGSAITSAAPRPSRQGEGVACTAVAAPKYAR